MGLNSEGKISAYTHLKELFIEYEKRIDLMFVERKEQLRLQFKALERELETSKGVLAKDLEHLNKLRLDVVEDRASLVLVQTFNDFKDSLEIWKREIQRSITTMETRYNSRITLAGIMGILSLLAAITAIVISILK